VSHDQAKGRQACRRGQGAAEAEVLVLAEQHMRSAEQETDCGQHGHRHPSAIA
jgi:hypothetical protein